MNDCVTFRLAIAWAVPPGGLLGWGGELAGEEGLQVSCVPRGGQGETALRPGYFRPEFAGTGNKSVPERGGYLTVLVRGAIPLAPPRNLPPAS